MPVLPTKIRVASRWTDSADIGSRREANQLHDVVKSELGDHGPELTIFKLVAKSEPLELVSVGSVLADQFGSYEQP